MLNRKHQAKAFVVDDNPSQFLLTNKQLISKCKLALNKQLICNCWLLISLVAHFPWLSFWQMIKRLFSLYTHLCHMNTVILLAT